jgi:cellulose synthase operon protein YhjU
MGFWSYYLLAKLLMFVTGYIGFHLWENLLFGLFAALPLRVRAARILKQIIAVPLAVVLLYHDSYLPPARRILAQSDYLAAFSLDYFLDLAQRFIHWPLVAALLALAALHWLLAHKLRMGSFALLGVLLSPLLGNLLQPAAPASALPVQSVAEGAPAPTTPAALEASLNEFYTREATRRVSFAPASQFEDPPYDILLLQICSLAWDDLDLVGQRQHPLLQRFDLMFEQFSSAATYSGPAAIRLLRAPCGQPRHEGLYQPAEPGCQLMSVLENAGFEPQWAMNHDGVFASMRADIRERGGLRAPLFPLEGLPVALRSFVGGEYFDDYAVLSAWWRERERSSAPRVALYYNSGTLHDGNRFLDGSRPSLQESYRRRLDQLFSGLTRFLDELEASGRRVVVVLVPEHGANLRGERLQISGLREIPSPGVSLIPVAVRHVGLPAAAQVRVEQPSSYLALAQLLASHVARNPYGPDAPPLPLLAPRLAETEFVAENDGTLVMRAAGRYWLRSADRRWSEYSGTR